jgi:tight adherence protein B
MLLAVMFGAAASILAAWAVATYGREHALAHRVDLVVPVPLPKTEPAKVTGAARGAARIMRALKMLFAFRMRRSWGISAAPSLLLSVAASTATAMWALGHLVMDLAADITTIAAAVGFFLVPRAMLVRQQRRADAAFAELLPDGIDMVIRMVRAGLPVAAAVRTVGQEGAAPLGTVFARVADQSEIGVPLDRALVDSSMLIGNPDFRFFAVAVALQQSTGGNLAVTLETLSEIIRRRRRVRLKAKSATAEVRLSALVLGAVPFVVSGCLLLVAPDYLNPLFDDPRGNVILGAALLCLLLAGVMMRTMIRRSRAV